MKEAGEIAGRVMFRGHLGCWTRAIEAHRNCISERRKVTIPMCGGLGGAAGPRNVGGEQSDHEEVMQTASSKALCNNRPSPGGDSRGFLMLAPKRNGR